ncbi:MAG: DUF2490 domain-containing protein [Bacteroidota bacterium]
MRLKQLLLFIFSLCLLVNSGKAQIDDTRLWAAITLKHKFTQKLSVSVSEQLRLDHDISQIDQLLSEAGIEYELKKNFKVSLNYRFINKNEVTYYGKSHRFYADVSYKFKPKRFSFTLRERIQEEYTSIYSSERGKIPEWLLRSKLAISYDTEKRYKPYVSLEMYYLIDNARESGEGISRMRYGAGVEYEFNRIHALDLGIIFQDYLQDQTNSFIYSIGYTYTL